MHILYWTGRALTRVLSRTLFGWQVTGREHVPPTGGFILAGNHISYYDPNLLGSSISREVYFFGKEELFSIPVVGWAIRRTNAMPVKRGAVDRAALKMAIGTIQKGHGLTIFPEVTRSKTGDFLSLSVNRSQPIGSLRSATIKKAISTSAEQSWRASRSCRRK